MGETMTFSAVHCLTLSPFLVYFSGIVDITWREIGLTAQRHVPSVHPLLTINTNSFPLRLLRPSRHGVHQIGDTATQEIVSSALRPILTAQFTADLYDADHITAEIAVPKLQRRTTLNE